MTKRLWVGNIAYSVTEDDLRALFGEYGELKDVYLLTNKDTGKSRGMAFIEYRKEEDAEAAEKELYDMEFSGSRLLIQPAHEESKRRNDHGSH